MHEKITAITVIAMIIILIGVALMVTKTRTKKLHSLLPQPKLVMQQVLRLLQDPLDPHPIGVTNQEKLYQSYRIYYERSGIKFGIRSIRLILIRLITL